MDTLQAIRIITPTATESLKTYDGGRYWYEILGWVYDPETTITADEALDRLVRYFPTEIPGDLLSEYLRESPVSEIDLKKKFDHVEQERVTFMNRKGNAICPKCKKLTLVSIPVQKSGGDEATSYLTECLDASCK